MADRTEQVNDGLGLPYSLEAEQSVLGAVLVEPDSINQLADKVRTEFFYLPEHQAIYRVMMQKMLENQRIDFVTVLEALKAERYFSTEDGKAYLLKLANTVPYLSNLENYAKIVRDKYEARCLIKAAREITEEAMDPSVETDMLLDSAEQRIYNIRQDRQTGGLMHIKDVLASNYEIFRKLTSDERDQYVGIPTGISTLDEVTSGLNRSDLIIVGARPGMGKTSFALNIAQNAAVNSKTTVAIFNLEMPGIQLANRMLSSEAMVNSESLKKGNIRDEDWEKIGEAVDVLSKANIYIDDTSTITVSEIGARCRKLKMEKNLGLVVIDYIQLMSSSRKGVSREQEIAEISRSLKILAKDLNIPIIALSQLSRAVEKRDVKEPVLSDLRESGSIEQDADMVMFLYREGYYNENAEEPNRTKCIFAKHRNGETGYEYLTWLGEFTKFSNWSGDREH